MRKTGREAYIHREAREVGYNIVDPGLFSGFRWVLVFSALLPGLGGA